MKFPRKTTENSLPGDLQGLRASKLRKSMIAVPRPDVGCGCEAECETGEVGLGLQSWRPGVSRLRQGHKTEKARARLRARACWGSVLAELSDGAPEPGADLLHAVVFGSTVRRGCMHGLAGFL